MASYTYVHSYTIITASYYRLGITAGSTNFPELKKIYSKPAKMYRFVWDDVA